MNLGQNNSTYSKISFQFFRYRLDISGRMFEWYAGWCCISIAAIMLIPVVEVSRFGTIALFYELGISDQMLGTVFMCIGLMRVFALAVNGHIGKSGPRMRAVGAMLGAVVWGQLAISLLYEALMVGRVSVSVAIFSNMAFFDFLAAYRAGLDVKRDW